MLLSTFIPSSRGPYSSIRRPAISGGQGTNRTHATRVSSAACISVYTDVQ